MIDFDEPLSAQGYARRDQILALAKDAARSRRRRRRIMPAAGCAALVLAISLVGLRRHSPHLEIAVNPGTSSSDVSSVERIATDPTIASRLSVSTTPRWETVDDTELLQSYAAAGQSAGLIRADGQTILLTDSPSEQ
jgi:hypothetical protein